MIQNEQVGKQDRRVPDDCCFTILIEHGSDVTVVRRQEFDAVQRRRQALNSHVTYKDIIIFIMTSSRDLKHAYMVVSSFCLSGSTCSCACTAAVGRRAGLIPCIISTSL